MFKKSYQQQDLFPDEILIKIFSNLPPEELCFSIPLVCKRFNAVSKDNVLWKTFAAPNWITLFPNLPKWELSKMVSTLRVSSMALPQERYWFKPKKRVPIITSVVTYKDYYIKWLHYQAKLHKDKSLPTYVRDKKLYYTKKPFSVGRTHLKVTICITGDYQIGKSALRERMVSNGYNSGPFPKDYSFLEKRVEIAIGDKHSLELEFLDTLEGEAKFSNFPKRFYKRAQIILVCYDITDLGSFVNIEQWIQEARRYASDHVLFFIVGLKAELASSRVVTEQRVKEYCEEKILILSLK